MARSRSGATRSFTVIAVIAVFLSIALFARPLPGEPTPWEYFREGLAHADSGARRSGLLFFTIVLMWLNFMAALARLRVAPLLPIILIALVALPAVSPQVRRSRLVRAGLGLLVVGVVPLVAVGTFVNDNPVGLGFLFAFLTPIAGLLILSGTILALTTKRSHDSP